MKKILFLFGTRPEAIKMAPLVKAFSQDNRFVVRIAITAQHREMLDQVLEFFSIVPDYDLNVMTHNQTLHGLTATLVERITSEVLDKENFDLVFVQGDTTTVLAASLAAFYKKIKIAHIEAGLRSHDMYSPFPEEMNRVLTSRLAHFHFCPTNTAAENLTRENITQNVFVTGNTVIDALFTGLDIIKNTSENLIAKKFSDIDFTKKIILVTCHRRENFGAPFDDICTAIQAIATANKDVEIIYPVHPNPNIKEKAHTLLTAENIKLIAPLNYDELIWMMSNAVLILTDSGGIQEEAPSLGKPVLVLREVTERMEGVDAGTAVLVGSDTAKIIAETEKLLTDSAYYNTVAAAKNPYGNGDASNIIRQIVLDS
jgi:UDP-N-acetylglucosamine 2-epimerase (non-hydrolysing)